MKTTTSPTSDRPSASPLLRDSRTADVALPVSSAAELEQALARATAARARVLDEMATAEIGEILAAAAEAWTRPHYGPRQRVLPALARELRMPRPLLEKGLDAIFGVVTEEAIADLVRSEISDPRALDGAVAGPGGRSRARLLGPRILFHSLAGNVPGLAIPPIVAGLLARSISIVRDSERQPYLTTAFVATLADFSSDLASMVIPAAWRAGDMGMERLVFECAQRIELTGSDSTMRSIVSRHPRRPIVTRGSRVSIGVVARESDTDRWQEGFATDVVMYEGLGCLTPQTIFVEGDRKRAARLARLLGIQLSRYEALYPRIPRDVAAETRRRAFVEAAELAAIRDPASQLLRGRGDSWLVQLSAAAGPTLGPGLRTVVVTPVESRAELVERIRRSPHPLAGVGLGLEPEHPAFPDLVSTLESLGATLVCEPGRMQRPPIAWAQDGQRRLADLVEWRAAGEAV